MDINKVYNVCREIARKTKPPKDGFEKAQLRILLAHQDLWLTMLYDAFGVETDEDDEEEEVAA